MNIILKALFFFMLVALTGCEKPVQLNYVSPSATVVAFGDSLTYGTGAKQESSYPSALASLRGSPIINEGTPGDTTIDGLNKVDAILDKHEPDFVILCLGGNDFLRRRAKSETKENLGRIIDRIEASGAQVMLIAVPDIALFPDDEELYRELADEKNIALLENKLTSLLTDDELKSDAVHLNAKGYKLLAQAIDQFVRERGGW